MEDFTHNNLGPTQLRIYIQVGDCGPDQAAMRRDIATSWKSRRMQSMYFGFACLAHQMSLSECRVVALTDTICGKAWGLKFNYFASLVKINHLVREANDALTRSAAQHEVDPTVFN